MVVLLAAAFHVLRDAGVERAIGAAKDIDEPGFVGNEPKQNAWKSIKEVPAKTPESDAMSKELKRRGFKFVGSTICYAFMQAVGMVNDHLVECFRHGELSKKARKPK